jgi:hypothetical protein
MVAGQPWSREDIRHLLDNPNATSEEVQAAGFCLGRTHHAIRLKRDDLRLKRFTVRDEMIANAPVQLVTRSQTLEEREAYFRTVETASMLRSQGKTRTDETEWFSGEGMMPIGLKLTGDWHCGAHGVMYDALDRDLEILRDTPGLYGVGMGDFHEGVSIHSKAAPALYSGCYSSGDEQEERVMMRFRAPGTQKWVVLIKGNHDAWVERHAGLSRLERQCGELGIPCFGEGGGTLYMNVGEQRYAVGLRHNTSGNSQLNTTNAQRRMVDGWWNWDTLHVAAIAHLHYNDLHIAPRHGKRCVYLRGGSYKIYDSYSKAGHYVPEMGTPLLIFLPDEEKVLAYRGDDFLFGLEQLAMLRERYFAQYAA